MKINLGEGPVFKLCNVHGNITGAFLGCVVGDNYFQFISLANGNRWAGRKKVDDLCVDISTIKEYFDPYEIEFLFYITTIDIKSLL